MIYTGAPQNTRRKPVEKMRIDDAKERMRDVGFDQDNIIVHAPYIVNLANPAQEKRDFAIEFLIEEVKRTGALGSKTIVLHPGAHLKQGPEKGASLIAEGVNKILEATKGSPVRIALEGMAGKGTEVGKNFEELAMMIEQIDDAERIGVCLDTCHLHEAGYDIVNDLDGVIEEFDRIVGLDKLLVWHVNDSKNTRGAHKDRHANIGFGGIGFDAIMNVMYHEKFEHLVKILETPYVRDGNGKKKYPPYKHEIAMIRDKTFNPDLLEEIREDHES
jgi:deoxyribonuclease-4